jgi:hypothetical protein
VSLGKLLAIDHRRRLTFNKLGKYIGAMEYVDVIVRSSNTKEKMPNPHLMICHCLKYHAATSFLTFVHSLPTKWIVLPVAMHIIDASKHP